MRGDEEMFGIIKEEKEGQERRKSRKKVKVIQEEED